MHVLSSSVSTLTDHDSTYQNFCGRVLVLEEILERRVDLVTPDALRESIKTEILKEAIDVTP